MTGTPKWDRNHVNFILQCNQRGVNAAAIVQELRKQFPRDRFKIEPNPRNMKYVINAYKNNPDYATQPVHTESKSAMASAASPMATNKRRREMAQNEAAEKRHQGPRPYQFQRQSPVMDGFAGGSSVDNGSMIQQNVPSTGVVTYNGFPTTMPLPSSGLRQIMQNVPVVLDGFNAGMNAVEENMARLGSADPLSRTMGSRTLSEGSRNNSRDIVNLGQRLTSEPGRVTRDGVESESDAILHSPLPDRTSASDDLPLAHDPNALSLQIFENPQPPSQERRDIDFNFDELQLDLENNPTSFFDEATCFQDFDLTSTTSTMQRQPQPQQEEAMDTPQGAFMSYQLPSNAAAAVPSSPMPPQGYTPNAYGRSQPLHQSNPQQMHPRASPNPMLRPGFVQQPQGPTYQMAPGTPHAATQPMLSNQSSMASMHHNSAVGYFPPQQNVVQQLPPAEMQGTSGQQQGVSPQRYDHNVEQYRRNVQQQMLAQMPSSSVNPQEAVDQLRGLHAPLAPNPVMQRPAHLLTNPHTPPNSAQQQPIRGQIQPPTPLQQSAQGHPPQRRPGEHLRVNGYSHLVQSIKQGIMDSDLVVCGYNPESQMCSLMSPNKKIQIVIFIPRRLFQQQTPGLPVQPHMQRGNAQQLGNLNSNTTPGAAPTQPQGGPSISQSMPNYSTTGGGRNGASNSPGTSGPRPDTPEVHANSQRFGPPQNYNSPQMGTLDRGQGLPRPVPMINGGGLDGTTGTPQKHPYIPAQPIHPRVTQLNCTHMNSLPTPPSDGPSYPRQGPPQFSAGTPVKNSTKRQLTPASPNPSKTNVKKRSRSSSVSDENQASNKRQMVADSPAMAQVQMNNMPADGRGNSLNPLNRFNMNTSPMTGSQILPQNQGNTPSSFNLPRNGAIETNFANNAGRIMTPSLFNAYTTGPLPKYQAEPIPQTNLNDPFASRGPSMPSVPMEGAVQGTQELDTAPARMIQGQRCNEIEPIIIDESPVRPFSSVISGEAVGQPGAQETSENAEKVKRRTWKNPAWAASNFEDAYQLPNGRGLTYLEQEAKRKRLSEAAPPQPPSRRPTPPPKTDTAPELLESEKEPVMTKRARNPKPKQPAPSNPTSALKTPPVPKSNGNPNLMAALNTPAGSIPNPYPHSEVISKPVVAPSLMPAQNPMVSPHTIGLGPIAGALNRGIPEFSPGSGHLNLEYEAQLDRARQQTIMEGMNSNMDPMMLLSQHIQRTPGLHNPHLSQQRPPQFNPNAMPNTQLSSFVPPRTQPAPFVQPEVSAAPVRQASVETPSPPEVDSSHLSHDLSRQPSPESEFDPLFDEEEEQDEQVEIRPGEHPGVYTPINAWEDSDSRKDAQAKEVKARGDWSSHLNGLMEEAMEMYKYDEEIREEERQAAKRWQQEMGELPPDGLSPGDEKEWWKKKNESKHTGPKPPTRITKEEFEAAKMDRSSWYHRGKDVRIKVEDDDTLPPFDAEMFELDHWHEWGWEHCEKCPVRTARFVKHSELKKQGKSVPRPTFRRSMIAGRWKIGDVWWDIDNHGVGWEM